MIWFFFSVYQQQQKREFVLEKNRAAPDQPTCCIASSNLASTTVSDGVSSFALQRDACRSPARERPVRRHCSVRLREQRLARLATLDCSVVVGISSSALSRARAVIPPGWPLVALSLGKILRGGSSVLGGTVWPSGDWLLVDRMDLLAPS